ncbi:hypothetical protein [Streptomyces sp. N50]|uniref:hypothetical protein n=1 Tax=Streptomyces sp. N50 TaxID=3081765 RepID=UPI0029624F43|nr:hypothetical protein [Streptomyces sp. N50]WOX11973.1 hypothetical protein R2B38_25445 [Streptomyces sp. N50]
MNWPAALSGAALRVTRTAVGRRVRRRVLQVALLVGGLFVLGVVFGGQAQAAEGGSVPARPVRLGQPQPVRLGKPGIPVVTSVVKSVPVLVPETTAQVVQPVADVVKTVTEVLAKVQVPPLSSLPTPPSLPAEPTLPVQTLPAQSTPVPVPATPQPSHGGGSDVGVATTAHRHASEPVAVSTHVASSATYGPNVGAVGRAAAVRPALSPSAGRAPAQHQAPVGDPDGAQRNQPGVDNGGSRHCDACAVTLGFRVPVRIVPGVVVGADAAETRDRYRDVPVFPG